MQEQVRSTVRRYHMAVPGDRVLVAVSGGPDSVALLHALHTLSPELGISLHVFHMDHNLRGAASAEDAAYVQQLSSGLDLPCSVVTLKPGELKGHPGSLQANARAVRYRHMASLAKQVGAVRVAMGHNRDDLAETVLMRFLRGTGSRGLAGIPPVRSEGSLTYVRPLLDIPRTEIENYCRQHELFPRRDESNDKPTYLRNRLRLELMPQLSRAYNPALAANLAQLAAIVREEDVLLDTMAREALARCLVPGEGASLQGNVLRAEPLALARRVVRLAAREALAAPVELSLGAVDQVLEAAGQPHGSLALHLPGGLQVRVEYGICRFQPPAAPLPAGEEWPVALTGVTELPEPGLLVEALPSGNPTGPFEAAFDLDRLPGPLSIRYRRDGDRIWPTGMEGSKKLQDLLVDAKVPRSQRDTVPLLVAGDQVIWVVGYRLDRRYLADPLTEHTLFLRVTMASNPPRSMPQ